MPTFRRIMLDRLIDQQRKDDYCENFGWKHSRVDISHLRVSPRFDDTIFIFLIRNPWQFVSALHRRPYNLLPSPTGSLSKFIDSSFIANERDCLLFNFVPNPVDFWNIKVGSYFIAQPSIKNSFICYFEEILRSPKDFLDSLRTYHDMHETCSIPMESTKSDNKTFLDYQKESAEYNPQRKLGEKIYLKVLEKLDMNVLNKTPYKYHECSLGKN